jgi:hypothetical protein
MCGFLRNERVFECAKPENNHDKVQQKSNGPLAAPFRGGMLRSVNSACNNEQADHCLQKVIWTLISNHQHMDVTGDGHLMECSRGVAQVSPHTISHH